MMTETLQYFFCFLVNLYYFVTEMQTNGFNDWAIIWTNTEVTRACSVHDYVNGGAIDQFTQSIVSLLAIPGFFFLKQKWLITNGAQMWKSVDFVCFPKGKEIGPLYDLVVRIYSDMICIKVAGNCETGEKGRSIFKGLGKPKSFSY